MTDQCVAGLQGVVERLNLEQSLVPRAVATLERAPALAFSGWLASGKDTVADEVYRQIGVPSVKASLAAPLKEELTQIMRIAARSGMYRGAIVDVAATMGVRRLAAEQTIDLLIGDRYIHRFQEAVPRLEAGSGWDRTTEVRRALQFWGTNVRRSQRASYWVERAVEYAIGMLAEGVVPYFCDCRFPDEVVGLQEIGFRVVRLEVTRETQRRRLLARDGIEPDPEALSHPSETALDGFSGFDLVVDNNGTADDAVREILVSFL